MRRLIMPNASQDSRAEAAGLSREQLTQQLRLSEAMAQYSRVLHKGYLGSEINCGVLSEALASLLVGSAPGGGCGPGGPTHVGTGNG